MQPTVKSSPCDVGVSLREAFPDSRFFGGEDLRVTSCTAAATACRPGDLFVARMRAESDGHDDVEEAVRRGAAGVLAERPLLAGVPVCVVPDSRIAYGRLCQLLAGQPAQQLATVGVTGTNGKTTTCWLTAAVLAAAGRQTGLLSDLGYSDAYETVAPASTSPGPPDVAHWLARMVSSGCTDAVLEVSSQSLAQHDLAGVSLDAAVVTNLRRDHLDLHGSVLQYRKIKTRLFDHLKPGGFAVVNVDDPGNRWALKNITDPVMTVAMWEEAEVTATVVERDMGEQTFLLEAGNETVPVRTRMIGDHHVLNCLAAAAVGLVQGIRLTTIARALESVASMPGRLERIECGQGFGVFVDTGRTPDRVAMCLKTLRKATRGRLLCVVGCDDQTTPADQALLGRVVERGADVGVLTASDGERQASSDAIHDMLDGYDRPARAHVIPTRLQAIRWALDAARPGDAVLLASGPDAVEVREDGRLGESRDARIARHWLYRSSNEAAMARRAAMG